LNVTSDKNLFQLIESVSTEGAVHKSAFSNPSLALLSLPAANMVVAGRKEMTDTYDQFTNLALARLGSPYWTWSKEPSLDEQVRSLKSGPLHGFRYLFVLLLATGVALAEEAPDAKRAEAQAKKKEEAQAKTKGEAQAKTKEEPKEDPNLGMSILGNQEAPTSLVIVPWKSSEVGRATGISPMLDDSRQPVDKEVFMRELRYYEIRSEKKP